VTTSTKPSPATSATTTRASTSSAPPIARAAAVEFLIARGSIAIDADATLLWARSALADRARAALGPNVPYSVFLLERREWVLATARVGLVEGLVAGRLSDWRQLVAAAEVSVAEQLFRNCQITSDNAGPLRGRLSEWVETDRSELETLHSRLLEPRHGVWWAWSLSDGRKEWERLACLEARLPAREAALDGFDSAFKARVAAVVEANRESLVIGLLESGVLSARHTPPASIERDRGELAGVNARLAAIGAVSAAMGPVSVGLVAKARELEASITSAAAAYGPGLESAVRQQLDVAAAGDMEAWRVLCRAVTQGAPSFRAGLAETLSSIAAEAMLRDPAVWAACAMSGRPDSPGRDLT
jgi:hypothetical protein